MVSPWQGAKRKAVSGYQSHDDSSDNSECTFPFKYAYGVNAWKHWVRARRPDGDLPLPDAPRSRKGPAPPPPSRPAPPSASLTGLDAGKPAWLFVTLQFLRGMS